MQAGVDTGGTFTDAVAVVGDRVRVLKLPSTPSSPGEAVLSALKAIGLIPSPEPSSGVVHGTTVATNALLEAKGGPTALILTEGFRHLLEIGRQNRERIYDLLPSKPVFPVSGDMIFTARERTLASGDVARALSQAQVRRIVGKVKKSEARSAAVCFLHSYANPENEMRLGEALREAGIPVSPSHEVVREFREFERCSTTFVNAYLAPVVRGYVGYLADELRGVSFSMMQSSGGIASASRISRMPVRTLLSGPAAGVVGAAHVAKRAGFDKILTLDMGGTSTDVSLVDREAARVPSLVVGGFPVLSPSILMETVGAGGGSLAYVDPGGALRVGPESAGADPGPACYGKSDRPAVTDAHLVLGRIPEVGLLGGEFQLDAERARKAVGGLARELGVSVEKAAEGVIRVADASMERAIRVVSVEKGYDPRDFALVAFGGAGGLHACGLAEALGMATVFVPPQPGVLSAYGLLCADAAEEKSRTVFLNPRDHEALSKALNDLRDEVREVLMTDQGPLGRVKLSPMVDLRYVGQSYEISVPFAANLVERFHKAHKKLYGHAEKDAPVEAVNVRVRGVRAGPPPPPLGGAAEETGEKPKTGRIWWRGGRQKAGFFSRSGLEVGRPVKGPAIVYEYSATMFVPPGWIGAADEMGNFILRRKG